MKQRTKIIMTALVAGALLIPPAFLYYKWRKDLRIEDGYYDTSESAMRPLVGFNAGGFRFGVSFCVQAWDGSRVAYEPGIPLAGAISHDLKLSPNNSPAVNFAFGVGRHSFSLVLPTP